MSMAAAAQAGVRIFPYERWGSPQPALARQYRENNPCPHILLKDFLEPQIAREMAEQFPQAASDAWTQYKHANENKLGMPKRELFPPTIGAVTDELNSPEFVPWVSEFTGIPDLTPAPILQGPPLNQSSPAAQLNVPPLAPTPH